MEPEYDFVCLSHLRWDFVYQRPQHLMTRAAREGRRVFFIEEPIPDEEQRLEIRASDKDGVVIVAPHLPPSLSPNGQADAMKGLMDELCDTQGLCRYVAWYYSPMALTFARHLEPLATVYDCMDELSAFLGAPIELRALEKELLERANLVFTGGRSLYEAKRLRHPRVRLFPSSIDAGHFRGARRPQPDPSDQGAIPHPRIGFFGVIDERMDLDLVDRIAYLMPEWQLVFLGPVIKIDESSLPRRENIHYLGQKRYDDLPRYLAGWDVAVMPFAHNEATRFISPTKTLEYLAGGKPVVSTPIHDVVHPYGEQGLVHIAESADEFVQAIEEATREDLAARLRDVEVVLAQTSWDRTWQSMSALVSALVEEQKTTIEHLIKGIPPVFVEQAFESTPFGGGRRVAREGA